MPLMTKNSKKQPVEAEIIGVLPKGYALVLETLLQKIKSAQTRAMVAVNKELIEVYRDIGKTIYEQQQNGEWGNSVVRNLAKDLQKDLPGMKGFSYRNLYLMCKDPLEREFYMKMSKKNGWTYRVLIHHIEVGTFEKTVMTQSNFEKALPVNLRPEAILAVKDEYALDFLELGDKHTERELEGAIVRNIEKFLREVFLV